MQEVCLGERLKQMRTGVVQTQLQFTQQLASDTDGRDLFIAARRYRESDDPAF